MARAAAVVLIVACVVAAFAPAWASGNRGPVWKASLAPAGQGSNIQVFKGSFSIQRTGPRSLSYDLRLQDLAANTKISEAYMEDSAEPPKRIATIFKGQSFAASGGSFSKTGNLDNPDKVLEGLLAGQWNFDEWAALASKRRSVGSGAALTPGLRIVVVADTKLRGLLACDPDFKRPDGKPNLCIYSPTPLAFWKRDENGDRIDETVGQTLPSLLYRQPKAADNTAKPLRDDSHSGPYPLREPPFLDTNKNPGNYVIFLKDVAAVNATKATYFAGKNGIVNDLRRTFEEGKKLGDGTTPAPFYYKKKDEGYPFVKLAQDGKGCGADGNCAITAVVEYLDYSQELVGATFEIVLPRASRKLMF
ncbi:hypothetical protein WJX72_004740 [[Myrmecia] bisecta]|uniref:Uncharacterized protein n=1 Tax=[Myrmecia] bisecta TaxID=41462 RepID=A0AAW1PRR5_9CHLO